MKRYRRKHDNFTRRGLIGRGLALVAAASGLSGRSLRAQGVAAPLPPSRSRAADDLVTANRILASEGILDAYGHVSVRVEERQDRFFLSRALAPALVSLDDILEYDLDGNALQALARAAYLERFIHAEIYKARADVRAIVHCHTPSLIPFANAGVPLRPMSHMSSFVAQGVPVFEIRSVAGIGDMLIRTPALGRALATTLADKPAVLMRGHGAVVVADSVPAVVGRSIYLDLNAKMQAQAIAFGAPITYLENGEGPQSGVSNPETGGYGRQWELWKRRAVRED